MAGRAGRRGMDPCGFVYTRVNPMHIAYREVEQILYGRPEPVISQFNTVYATLLNLYRDFGLKLLDVYPRSLHAHQASEKRRREAQDLMKRKLDLMRDMGYLGPEGLTSKGEFASVMFGYELPLAEMYAAGFLETLNDVQLCMILSSLVFEPRKSDHLPPSGGEIRRLEAAVQPFFKKIQHEEVRYRIRPLTKRPFFHNALAIKGWIEGRSFDDLFRVTSVDEGELVRNFRMVVQLLRELAHAPHLADAWKKTTHRALEKVNRGIVDAEKQLRV
jgi:superfamily II RNA helicase